MPSKTFRSHLSDFHKIKTLFSRCFACMRLVRSTLYNLHLASVHRLSPTRTYKCLLPHGIRADTMDYLSSDYGAHACEICASKPAFSTIVGLQAHMKLVHPVTHTRYGCTKCTNTYKRQSSLITHLFKVHGVLSWKCVFCSMLFRFRTGLRAHLESEHNNPQNRFCQICNIPFKGDFDYTEHVLSQHNGSAAFKCFLCDAQFTNHKTFSSHACRLNL